MTDQSNRPSAFGGSGENRSAPRIDTRRQDPAVAAVIAKLVAQKDNGATKDPRKNRGLQAPDMSLLQKISDVAGTNVQDAASLFQLLPDTELAMQILVSSILSPKDMVNVDLNYTVEQTAFDGAVVGSLLEKVTDYFQNTYKITDLLPKILQDVLFYAGSYPLAILPENSIDDAINSPERVSLESVSDQLDRQGHTLHLGILGQKREGITPGMESLFGTYTASANYDPKVHFSDPKWKGWDPLLTVTDNPSILKMPMLREKIQNDRVQDVLASRKMSMKVRRETVSHESINGKKDVETSLYRRRRYRAQPVLAIKPPSQMKKKAVGHPLVMKLPHECVIPVHMPSNPEEHLGYFVLVDPQGNPVVHAKESDYYTDLQTNINSNREMVSQLIATTKRETMGRETSRDHDMEELARIYSDLVEEDLIARLKHGVYGDDVAVGKPQDVYRIMMARAFAKMHTQVLYIPRELMTYIAFDYNKYGLGTSLLQNSKIIGGLRAMLLFAHTMADIKNSVQRTRLNITLDPNDPDPSNTVEFLMHEYAKTRQASYPLGASNPIDIVSFLQNSAVDVAVSGNTAYPETKMDIEDKQSNKAKPDQELENSLRDRHLMSMGLSPETVTAGAGAEFATSVVQNNLLLTKRVMIYQQLLVSFISDFVQKYVLNSGYLMDELREIIEENYDALTKEQKDDIRDASKRIREEQDASEPHGGKDDIFAGSSHFERQAAAYGVRSEESHHDRRYDEDEHRPGVEELLLEFVNAIRVTLPAPDTSTLENQMKSFDQYVEALDKAIAAYIDTTFMDASSMGELQEYIEPTKAAIKAHYIRQWLRNNNVLTELDELTTLGDDGKPALNLWETTEAHLESLGKSIQEYMTKLMESAKARNEAMQKVKEETGITGGATDGTMGGDAGTTDTTDDFGSLDGGAGGGSDDLNLDASLGGGDDLTGGEGSGSTETSDTGDTDLNLDASLDASDTTTSTDTTTEPADTLTGDEASTTDTMTTTDKEETPEAAKEDDLSLDTHLEAAKPAEEKSAEEPKPTEEPKEPAEPVKEPEEEETKPAETEEKPAEEPANPSEEETPDLNLDEHLGTSSKPKEGGEEEEEEEEDPNHKLDTDLNLDSHLSKLTNAAKNKFPPPPKKPNLF